MEPLNLYPVWRQAVKDFLGHEYQAGDVVSYAWLYQAFQLPSPDPTMQVQEADKINLQFLSHFKNLEKALLEESNIALRNVRGKGFQVVPAREQSEWALAEGLKEIKKELSRMNRRVAHVELSQLTAEERRKNADILARVSSLRNLMKPKKVLEYNLKRIGNDTSD